jgi:hypothetical protein
MLRVALVAASIALVAGACTPAQAPVARKIGKVMALGGVTGLLVGAATTYFIGDSTRPVLVGFSVVTTVGIATYAAGELTGPSLHEESIPERNQRWARILTERAHGYARDGRCSRVRHIETRVRVYDRVLHEGVFMRDPAIQKCMANEPPPAPKLVEPPAVPGTE